LENFELVLADQPSALLIGKNGAGKSTVGFALELLQRIARGTNRIGQLASPQDLSRGRSNVPMRFEIEVQLKGETYLYGLALEFPEGFKELRVLEERLVVGGRPIYERAGSQVVLSKTAKDREAKFLVDWHLVALPVIQEQSPSDPLYIFKTWLARMIILAPIPEHISGDSEGDTLDPKRDATNFGEWFSGLLAFSPGAYSQVDETLRSFLPDIADVKNPITGKDFRSLTVQFRQGGADLSLPFKDLSDGEKCFFICAVVLAANKAYGPIFCFWDEPDNFLSLSEVGMFVMALRRSFENGGQMLVTSHHSEALRRFSDENTFALYRRSHLEPTLVRKLSELQYTGDLVEAIIRDDLVDVETRQ
jgi:predicted ATPase